MSAPSPLAPPESVADHLGVTVQTLAAWRWRGKGPKFVKVGRMVRYDWAEVAAWVQRGGDRNA